MRTRITRLVLWVTLLTLFTGSLYAQEERWVYRYSGLEDGDDKARSIVMGTDGTVYAAGWTTGSTCQYDFTVVSLTPSGDERWVYRYNGPGDGWDKAWSIVMGTDGNLYAAGYSHGSRASPDFTVISLTPSGDERWVYRCSSVGGGLAYAIVTGADDNIYAAGYSRGSGTYIFTVISLTPSGDERWVYRHNGTEYGNGLAKSIAVGTDGNLYVAGRSTGTGTSHDFTVISLDTLGTERWVYSYDSPGHGGGLAYSIVMGMDGNLYAAGYSRGSGTDEDLTIISLTSSGAERWVYRYNGPGNGYDFAYSIVTGGDGNIYAAGASWGGGTAGDFTVVSLTPWGEGRWVCRYNSTQNLLDRAFSIVTGTDGNLYAAGQSERTILFGDFTVISIRGVSVAEAELLQVSAAPVPASGSVKIQYCLPKAAEVKLAIYDVIGRLVSNLVDSEVEAGWSVVFWDGRDHRGKKVRSGTYFAQLQTSDSWTSQKLIIF